MKKEKLGKKIQSFLTIFFNFDLKFIFQNYYYMFIKLGIIAGVIILTGMIFSTEINNMFPATSATVTNSLKEDVTSLSVKASNTIEQKIDNSIDTIVNKTSTYYYQ